MPTTSDVDPSSLGTPEVAAPAPLDATLDRVEAELAGLADLEPAAALTVFGSIHTTLTQALATTGGDAVQPRPPVPGRPGGR